MQPVCWPVGSILSLNFLVPSSCMDEVTNVSHFLATIEVDFFLSIWSFIHIWRSANSYPTFRQRGGKLLGEGWWRIKNEETSPYIIGAFTEPKAFTIKYYASIRFGVMSDSIWLTRCGHYSSWDFWKLLVSVWQCVFPTSRINRKGESASREQRITNYKARLRSGSWYCSVDELKSISIWLQ